ncbi:MAG: ATP-binding cassette domain-containing protein [Rhodospirillales bacterium]
MTVLLRVESLSRPGLLTVEDLSVAAGECLAIGGPSGAGKSLLLRALVDLDPNAGEVFLAGVARSSLSAQDWRRKVAYLPAESGWWDSEVASHFADRAKAEALLEPLRLSAEALDWQVQRLSTGERQRLALIRALIGEPSVLLLDEPTSALDDEAEAAVERLLRRLLDQGRAAILVTHDGEQAGRLAKRRRKLVAGRLLAEDAA